MQNVPSHALPTKGRAALARTGSAAKLPQPKPVKQPKHGEQDRFLTAAPRLSRPTSVSVGHMAMSEVRDNKSNLSRSASFGSFPLNKAAAAAAGAPGDPSSTTRISLDTSHTRPGGPAPGDVVCQGSPDARQDTPMSYSAVSTPRVKREATDSMLSPLDFDLGHLSPAVGKRNSSKVRPSTPVSLHLPPRKQCRVVSSYPSPMPVQFPKQEPRSPPRIGQSADPPPPGLDFGNQDLDQCSIPDSPSWHTLFDDDEEHRDLFEINDSESIGSLTSAANSNEDPLALLGRGAQEKTSTGDLLDNDFGMDSFSVKDPLHVLATPTDNNALATMSSVEGLGEWLMTEMY